MAFPVAANSVGTAPDVARIVSLAHEAGALAWADAVHYAPHGPIDVAAWDVDVLICSPYKFFGPHLGLAFGKSELIGSWRPYKVRPAANEPIGHRYELGTLPHELLAGFVAAVDYVDSLGWDAIRAHELALGERFLAGLPEKVELYGLRTMAGRVPTFCFNVPGLAPEEVATRLAERELAVWHGELLRARDDAPPRARGRRRASGHRPLQHRGRGRPAPRRPRGARARRVKLLLLGGPKFLGRAVTDAALARGHELTFFNRGQTNPDLYPEVERLRGDREHDLGALEGREWDAVIDTCGFLPHVVRASAEALAGSGLYCFVSSISVYDDFGKPIDEDSELAPLGDQPADSMAPDFANYGALKALCEQAVRDVFGGRALLVRPGLIVGPHDPTGRFSYWPHRVARGGEVLAPGPPERPTQFVDVRDLGEWMVGVCERRVAGAFNATHPGVTFGELLAACAAVAGNDTSFTWVTDEFLLEQEVGQWMELPLWLAGPENAYVDRADVSRALAAGLRFRPLAETVRGTLEEAPTTDAAGLAPEREAALLAAWHGR